MFDCDNMVGRTPDRSCKWIKGLAYLQLDVSHRRSILRRVARKDDSTQNGWLGVAHELGTVERDLLDAVRGVHQFDVVGVAAVDLF